MQRGPARTDSMRTLPQIVLTGLFLAALAGACVCVLSGPDSGESPRDSRSASSRSARDARPAAGTRSDPEVPGLGENYIDDSGYDLAFRYSAPVLDRSSLAACYASAAGRSERGIRDCLSLL